jgi:hypothetical protein
MEQTELEEYLARQSLPATDIACISDWIGMGKDVISESAA